MVPRLLALASFFSASLALRNGLALTPPMGWNSWNYFSCGVNEDIVLRAAKSMISYNLTRLGYEYVLVDDCWQADTRDPKTGAPVEDKGRFPNGMKDLVDKVHAMGLKFGIYSSAGTYTCAGRFGSLGYEEIDAKTYAGWGVDYLKYDNCYNEGRAGTPMISYERYNNMSMALNATGRPMVYSMCNWGEDGPWNFAIEIANSYRISGDIYPNYNDFDIRCPCTDVLDCKLAGFHCSVMRILDFSAPIGQKSGSGHWNDLDMLEIGNDDMTLYEQLTHFSMWALVKSPLILGNDVTSMTPQTLTIITNDALIAINQDGNGPITRRWKKPVKDGEIQLWSGGTANNSIIFTVLNTSPTTQTVYLDFADVFYDQGRYYARQNFKLFDLWMKDETDNWGAPAGQAQFNLTLEVATHSIRVFRATPAPLESAGSAKRESEKHL
ncbi:glycoside hydrolase [Epithele typhae]|uniref:glycoside hydrolase n=1 Tax=Epithele typhae TaxID=378194 RepID=UPI002008788D|nr:glycoside hydrolase [Epithele typhae]KAH9921937.1 glycoside hydrolase [Epithele typhae]